MCWCDEYEFTINRADDYMIRRKSDGKWYSIDPDNFMRLIEKAFDDGLITITNTTDNFYQIETIFEGD